MQCRVGCGACCIAPSISSSIPGMVHGKPAGVRCIHLNKDYCCLLYEDSGRPEVCEKFQASEDVCGNSQAEALHLLAELEACTS